MINFYTDKGVRLHTPLVWQSFFMQFLPDVCVQYVNAENLFQGNPKAVVFPGGSAHEMGDCLGEELLSSLREWVHSGGTYIGVCAGAYLATSSYPWSLGIAPLEVEQPWNRGEMIVSVKLHSQKKVVSAEYWNGPIMTPTENVQYLAVFKNPFDGHPAVTYNKYGAGNVFLTVPHLERSPECKDFLAESIRSLLRDK